MNNLVKLPNIIATILKLYFCAIYYFNKFRKQNMFLVSDKIIKDVLTTSIILCKEHVIY